MNETVDVYRCKSKYTESVIEQYALKHYYSNEATAEQFRSDFSDFRKIRKAITRYYSTGKINIGFVFNTIITTINVFGEKPAADILLYLIPTEHYPAICTILNYLDIISDPIYDSVETDEVILEEVTIFCRQQQQRI